MIPSHDPGELEQENADLRRVAELARGFLRSLDMPTSELTAEKVTASAAIVRALRAALAGVGMPV